MGGMLSANASNEPDEVTGLTPKEKRLVQASWTLVGKNPVETGVDLFMT